ncbi:hypothetical protein AAMO2058_000478600 [Amorphochlora amoebiformis]
MLSPIRYCKGDIRHPSTSGNYSKTQMGSEARGNSGVTQKKARRSSPASFESVDPVSNDLPYRTSTPEVSEIDWRRPSEWMPRYNDFNDETSRLGTLVENSEKWWILCMVWI